MKTSELTGAALNWAVAKCEGATNLRHDTVATWWFTLNGEDRALSRGWSTKQNFAPSIDWAQGGPIIEQKRIGIKPIYQGYDVLHWSAVQELGEGRRTGPTPLIAAMRCYVASKLGDNVNVPEELNNLQCC